MGYFAIKNSGIKQTKVRYKAPTVVNLVKIVSAFIGKKVNTTFSSKEKWIDKKVWPIQLAFYDINQKLPNPKTKVVAHVDQNGISHYYEVNYGSYRMKGKLKKIEKIKDERC